jgi:hypothetical protein
VAASRSAAYGPRILRPVLGRSRPDELARVMSADGRKPPAAFPQRTGGSPQLRFPSGRAEAPGCVSHRRCAHSNTHRHRPGSVLRPQAAARRLLTPRPRHGGPEASVPLRLRPRRHEDSRLACALVPDWTRS